MAKKKKPTLKSNVNRGFATTSLPSKKEDSETNSTNPTSPANSTKGNSTPADPVTSSSSADQKNHADQIIKAMNQAGSENRRGNGETFDLSKVREQELQSLVDKLADKVDKEVAKTYKSIEFDRRLSKSLPAFVMDDKQLRDDILALAASSNSTSISSSNPTLNGITTNTSSNNVSGNVTPLEGKVGDASSNLNPIQSTSKTLLDLISSISLSESTSPSSISTSISPLTSSNATSFSEPEEKFLLKALTTHTLLRRLGFTRTQADVSIVGSGSLDLEDCLAYLTLILSQHELEAARKAADRGEIRRDVKERGPKNDEAEEKSQASSDQKSSEEKVVDEDDGMDSDEEPDETKPPSHPGYSFKRTTASRAALISREAQIQEAKETREKEEMELNSTSTDEKPSNEVIQASTDEVKSVLSSISETISALDTLERPTASWSSARVAQIQIDRLNSKRFKRLGKKWALKDADRVSSQIGKIREELRSLLNDAERQPSFDRKIAEQLFRRDQLKKDDEEFENRKLEEKREKELKEALEGKASLEDESSEGKVLTEEEKLKEEEEKEKKKKENLDPYGQGKHDSKNEIDLDPDMDGDSDEDDEPLFGDMLDETPTEVADVATGTTVQVKALPTQAKGGGGGKTGRTLLSDALKRVDPYAQSKLESVSGGGRIYRSRLTLRWRAPGTNSVNENAKKGGFVDVYTLTSIGCVNQNQADDLLAIVALSCMDKDKPTHRSLGPGFREWYEEIDSLRKEEKDSRARKRIDRISTVLQSRVEEARERKSKSKGGQPSLNAKNDGQADIGELARGIIKEAPENVKEKIRETFRTKVESQSYQDMLPQRQSLPIFKYRDHILSVLDSSQIFVLSGETGCGKSTQVPAYLLEHCLSKGEPCKIYVTEPRRISAISLAERVSAEMGEPKGTVGGNESLVGYAIRLESNVGRNAKLVYATTGIVLRMLEGTAFNEITHVIIDEVHERSIESDFLLIILKTLLQHRSDLKVILMSATVDAERISTYCGGCPTITVPGRTFPVEIRYIEDAVEMCDYTIEDGSPYARRPKRGQWNYKPDASNMAKLASTEDEEALRMEEDDDEEAEQGQRSSSTSLAKTRYNPKTISTLDRMDEFVINHDLIIKLIERICFSQDLEQYSAAILIFLPGLADIRKCHDLLTSHRSFGSNRFRVYPLHSTLTSESQASVFNVPPPGIRKIVIATNIAETGITIPDVTCVIDSGKQREMRFDEKKQISRLVEGFVAKSNAKQRRGRAGRVQEGLAFHLFTKFRHDQYFPDHPLPEMLRLSLQDLALKLKVMKIRIGTSIENALSLALDPPLAVNVQRAVSALVEVKALTANEEITPLGRHLSRLPLDVHMAKFLLIATLFKCLDPALTIAAALNSKSPFITPFGREAEADRSKASFKTGDSDFFSIANAFNAWRRAVGQNYGRQFCSKCFLSQQTLMQIEELRQQYMAYLLDSGFAQVDDETRKEMARNKFRAGSGKPRFMATPPDLDLNSNSMAILNAAISAGLYPKLLSIEPRSYQLKTIGNNQPVSIHPSSVNFRMRLSELPRGANHLVYFTIMSTKKLYAWETGAVDDRGVLVLCGEADWKMSSNSLYIDRQKIRMSIPDSKTLLALSILREQLTRLINTSFKNPGKPWTEEQQKFFVLAGKALGQGLNEKDQILQK